MRPPHAVEKVSKARDFLKIGKFDAARILVEEVVADGLNDVDSHSMLASILDRCGEWQSSLAHLRRAHELAPDGPQTRLNLAMALLRLGEYREGLRLYEARLDKKTWSGFATVESRVAAKNLLLAPNDSVDGKRVVLLAEQGLGDAVMCARYIPMLAQRGARIIVASNPTLRPFFARIPGIDTLLTPPSDQPLAQINLAALSFDSWLPLLSLPNWFRTESHSVPAEIPYWTADEKRVSAWRHRLQAAGRPGVPKVGLVFQASPRGAGFAYKSLQVADLEPLLSIDCVDFVGLQHGAVGRDLAAASVRIIDPMPAEVPLDEYAAAILATDLLITVDTMAAHLSGAFGHPTWVAVPHSPHWIWGLNTPTTPWYPAMRIIRQAKNRGWSDAIAAMAGALRESFGATATSSGRAPDGDALPGDAAQLDLALAQLRRGELAKGFASYEVRQRVPLWREQALPLPESLVAVEGRRLKPSDPVSRRRIAVFTEQGLGDTFLGARFLGALAERGAAITLVCRAPMRPFFARLAFLDELLSPPEDAPHAKIDLRRLSFDAWCPLLSLPHVLGFAAEAAQPRAPYLHADPAQIAAWRAHYRRKGHRRHRKVGLVWQANRSNTALANRSLRAADLAPLAEIDDVDFVNLQHGTARHELTGAVPHAIDPMQGDLRLDEFAAALAATDLVISVDTMAAHCAGALGHPVFVVLPRDPGWWWDAAGAQSRWYTTARLFRRGVGSDWTATIAAIADALRAGKPHAAALTCAAPPAAASLPVVRHGLHEQRTKE